MTQFFRRLFPSARAGWAPAADATAGRPDGVGFFYVPTELAGRVGALAQAAIHDRGLAWEWRPAHDAGHGWLLYANGSAPDLLDQVPDLERWDPAGHHAHVRRVTPAEGAPVEPRLSRSEASRERQSAQRVHEQMIASREYWDRRHAETDRLADSYPADMDVDLPEIPDGPEELDFPDDEAILRQFPTSEIDQSQPISRDGPDPWRPPEANPVTDQPALHHAGNRVDVGLAERLARTDETQQTAVRHAEMVDTARGNRIATSLARADALIDHIDAVCAANQRAGVDRQRGDRITQWQADDALHAEPGMHAVRDAWS